jgi:hypothetical protein
VRRKYNGAVAPLGQVETHRHLAEPAERAIIGSSGDSSPRKAKPIDTSCTTYARERVSSILEYFHLVEVDIDPDHVLRAIELLRADRELNDRRAQRIIICGIRQGTAGWRLRYPCKLGRLCPSCSARASAARAAATCVTAVGYRCPAFVTVVGEPCDAYALREALRRFGEAFGHLRRRSAFRRRIAGGVAAIDPLLAASGSVWSVHAHCVVDLQVRTAADAVDLERLIAPIRAEWADLMPGGRVLVSPDYGVEVVSPSRAAAYVGKASTVCPGVGTMSPEALRVHQRALRHRRVFVRWGTGRPQR